MFDARNAIHSALTAILVWLAVRLAMPDDMFSSSAAFGTLAQIADERVWAMALWLAATIGLVGLTTSSRGVKLSSTLVLSTMHGTLALCFLTASRNTATGTYAIIAALGYYLAWRRTRDRF